MSLTAKRYRDRFVVANGMGPGSDLVIGRDVFLACAEAENEHRKKRSPGLFPKSDKGPEWVKSLATTMYNESLEKFKGEWSKAEKRLRKDSDDIEDAIDDVRDAIELEHAGAFRVEDWERISDELYTMIEAGLT